jgi:hypothetical protein
MRLGNNLPDPAGEFLALVEGFQNCLPFINMLLPQAHLHDFAEV